MPRGPLIRLDETDPLAQRLRARLPDRQSIDEGVAGEQWPVFVPPPRSDQMIRFSRITVSCRSSILSWHGSVDCHTMMNRRSCGSTMTVLSKLR